MRRILKFFINFLSRTAAKDVPSKLEWLTRYTDWLSIVLLLPLLLVCNLTSQRINLDFEVPDPLFGGDSSSEEFLPHTEVQIVYGMFSFWNVQVIYP